MANPLTAISRCISKVMIYKGHLEHPLKGPGHTIPKRIATFEYLNKFREKEGKIPWTVTTFSGEELLQILSKENPEETLVVIPAGQSTRLQAVFTDAQTEFLQKFLEKGGHLYSNCGAAYWLSRFRIWTDLCEEQSEMRHTIIKTTNLPVFQGIAHGPLCPFPGKKYQTGFYSTAVEVIGRKGPCTIFLSGGGSFKIPKEPEFQQKVTVLARYAHAELKRLGKKEEEYGSWENAVIMVESVKGKGRAILSMFHPYYGEEDFDVEAYAKAFPDCGTNWKETAERISSEETRMHFVYDLICQLEEGFTEETDPSVSHASSLDKVAIFDHGAEALMAL